MGSRASVCPGRHRARTRPRRRAAWRPRARVRSPRYRSRRCPRVGEIVRTCSRKLVGSPYNRCTGPHAIAARWNWSLTSRTGSSIRAAAIVPSAGFALGNKHAKVAQESSRGMTIMSDAEEANSRRAEIASRNRRRILEARERKLSMAMFGLMAYSAFANFLGVVVTLGNSPADAGLGLVLGSLYSFGAYRVWSKIGRAHV